KTTNALERILKNPESKEDIKKIKDFHFQICNELFADPTSIRQELETIFEEIEYRLRTRSGEVYNFLYGQIVSRGELLSTKSVAAFLEEENLPVQYEDARNLIRTDNTWREGKIQWEETKKYVQEKAIPELSKGQIILTQGFIGGTQDGHTTTLG